MNTPHFRTWIVWVVAGLSGMAAHAQSGNTRQALTQVQSVGRSDLLCERLFQPTSPLDASMALGSAAAENLLSWALGSVQSGRTAPVGSNPAGMRKEDVQRFALRSVWLPVAFEELLGQRMAADLSLSSTEDLKGRRNARRYIEVQQTFDRLTAGLPADQPYRLRLMFSDEPGENASALPGGLIIVQQGLASRDAQIVAAVLSHEISHVLQRHQTRHYQSLLAESFDAATLARMSMGGRSDWDKAIDRLSKADQVGRRFASYHAEQELEADACMARLLREAGFNPVAVSKQFESWMRSKADSANKGPTGAAATDAYALRHPPSDERAQSLTRAAQHWASREPGGQTGAQPPTALTPRSPDSPTDGAANQASSPHRESQANPAPTGTAQDTLNRLTGSLRGLVKDLGDQIKAGHSPQDGQSEPLN